MLRTAIETFGLLLLLIALFLAVLLIAYDYGFKDGVTEGKRLSTYQYGLKGL